LDAVEVADMPDDQVEDDDASPHDMSRRNTMQYSRHDDISDEEEKGDESDSEAEGPSSDEQDGESENDDDV